MKKLLDPLDWILIAIFGFIQMMLMTCFSSKMIPKDGEWD